MVIIEGGRVDSAAAFWYHSVIGRIRGKVVLLDDGDVPAVACFHRWTTRVSVAVAVVVAVASWSLMVGLRAAAVGAVVVGGGLSLGKKVEAQRKTCKDKLSSHPDAWIHLSEKEE